MRDLSLETEQAKILARELLLAEAEGRETKWPEAVELRRARTTPALTAEETQQRIEHSHERHRAKLARSGARTRGSDGTSRLGPRELLARQNGQCYLCRQPLALADVQIEHIIPIAQGGKHTDENLAAACAPCNLEKAHHIVAFDIATRAPRFIR